MNQWQAAVEEFHRRSGGPGTLDTPEGRELRAKLIMEEAVETVAALGFDVGADIWRPSDFSRRAGAVHRLSDHVASFAKFYEGFHFLDFIDGMCDLAYVTIGGAVNADIDLNRHFYEVHRANMAKMDDQPTQNGPLGYKLRADGKVLKPEGWQPPDHQKVLDTYTRPGDLCEWEYVGHGICKQTEATHTTGFNHPFKRT